MGYSSAEEQHASRSPLMVKGHQEVPPLPQAIHDLLQAKATLDEAKGELAYFSAMDRLAARWLSALAVTGVPPTILKGVRKTLMLLSGVPKAPSVQGAQLALQDEALSADGGSLGDEASAQVVNQAANESLNETLLNILRQGVELDEVLPEKRLSMDEIAALHSPLLTPLQNTVKGLIALDDLGDALSLRPEQAAALCFSAGMVHWAKAGIPASDEEKTALLSDWLSHRGAHPSLVDVASKGGQRRDPSPELVRELKSIGEARALALWSLSSCLVHKTGLATLQHKGFIALLKKARLPMDEVLDVMELWASLDEQGRI